MQLNLALKHKLGLEMCWFIRTTPILTILFLELRHTQQQPIDSSTQRLLRCWRSIAFRPKKRTSNFGLIWNKVGTYKGTASLNTVLNDSRRFKSTAQGIGRNSKFQPKLATTFSSGRSFRLSIRCSSARAKGNCQSNMNTSLVIQWTQWAHPYMKHPDSVLS